MYYHPMPFTPPADRDASATFEALCGVLIEGVAGLQRLQLEAMKEILLTRCATPPRSPA